MDASPLPPTVSGIRSPLLANLRAPDGTPLDALDWSASPLGHPKMWSGDLLAAAGLMLSTGFPMFLAWGPDLAFLYNDSYAPILGDRHPAAFGRPFREVWPEVWDKVDPMVRQTLAGERVSQDDLLVILYRRGYPEEATFTFSYSPLYSASGAVEGVACICVETTDRVMGEHRLRAGEARLRGVLDGMDEAHLLIDREFRVLEINAEALRLDGRPREALIGGSHWDLWPGTRDSEVGTLYRRAMADGVPVSLEGSYAFPDGRTLFYETRAYPHPEGLAVFTRDVTARHRVEEERRRLAAVVEQSRDFIGIADPDGRGLYVNPAGRRLVKLPGSVRGRRHAGDRLLPRERSVARPRRGAARPGRARLLGGRAALPRLLRRRRHAGVLQHVPGA